jgi:hypothetical protein
METYITNDKNEQLKVLLNLLQDKDSLDRLSKWTCKLNIFDVLKISKTEIRHSNMLSWLLDPNENHGLDDEFLYGIICRLTNKISNEYILKLLSSNLFSFNVYREWENIDILLTSSELKCVIAIENKIGSHEHSHGSTGISQLKVYKETIENKYKGWTCVFLYLTPEGEEPSEEDWSVITYSDVLDVLETVNKKKETQLIIEARILINNYIDNIKNNVIMDEKLVKLCNEIYKKHRLALDLIYENRDDLTLQISNTAKDLLKDTDIEKRTKTYIKFRTESLMKYFNDTEKNSYFYYQFKIEPDRIFLELTLHKDKGEDLSPALDEKMKNLMKKDKGNDWNLTRACSFKINNYKDLSLDEIKNELQKMLKKLKNYEETTLIIK